MVNRVFILGCQRTGTTLMRLILDSHPKIECFDEIRSSRVFDHGGPYSKNKPITGLKMPQITELFIESNHVKQKYNNDPIIFMKRDVLPTIASMKRMGPDWIRDWVLDKLQKYRTDPNRRFGKVYNEVYQEAREDPQFSDLKQVALYWLYKISMYSYMVRLKYPVIEVQYDNLVNNPTEEMQRVVNFLGIDWSENLLCHHLIEHKELFKDGLAAGRTSPRRAIDQSSLYKWEDCFTDKEKEVIIGFLRIARRSAFCLL